MVDKKIILPIGIFIICLSITFLIADILVIPTSFGIVPEDTSYRYNVTINNTGAGQLSNITAVNITLPSNFTFTGGTDGTSAEATFTNTSTVLSWVNTSEFLINGTYNMSFWFNASVAIPAVYNFTVSVLNGTGLYYTNHTVTINDTTYPAVSIVTPVTGANISGSYVINVSITEDTASLVYFNITNASGTQNGSLTPSQIPGSYYWNATWNTSLFNEGTYNVSVWVNDSNNQINNTVYTHTILVDNTAPAITAFSCSPSSVYNDNTVTCTCTASDSGSGISSTSYTENPSTSSIGTFTESCTVTDRAGNAATASASYTVTTRSGGAAVSSGSSYKWSMTYKVLNDQFMQGYTKQLSSNQRLRVIVGNIEHYVGVKSISTDSVTIEIASDPIEITLNAGENAKADVNDDGIYDIYVILNDIINNKADITIKQIQEAVPVGEEPIETTGEIVQKDIEETTPQTEKESSNMLIWIIVIIAISIIVGVLYKYKDKFLK